MPKINQEEYEVLKEVRKDMNGRWHWLAKDEEGVLRAYNTKPERKAKYGSWGNPPRWSFKHNDNLFQFIKWEDEEPYNINELIEEYEKDYKGSWEHAIEFSGEVFGESEETEVKNHYESLIDKVVIEKPTIPQFVADWIEGNKQFEEKWNDYSKEDAMNDTIHFTIYGLFADYPATNSHVELRKPVLKWLSVDRGNYFKLVNAVRYGYEVEKEPKYRLKLNGDYLSSVQVDYGAEKGKPIEVTILAVVKGLPYGFSENEKSYVEKYLNVEVEELEE